ncbi:MAG: hypothetical protein EXS58_12005 [Candidatus Latescibacteria bacterium]|nr:hypothetical protein [Candidatus Latescibacterota bacterium]
MKTFSALLCAGLVLTAGAFSAATGGGMKHGHGMKHGQGPGHQELNLSDEQKAQLEPLKTEFQKQQQELRAQIKAGTLSREEGQAQMKAAAEAHRTAFEALLTDEQRQNLAEWKQNHPAGMDKGGPGMMGKGMGRGGKGMGRGKGELGLGRMAEALGLSEEQKTQWEELAKQQRAKMEELRHSGQKPEPEAMRQLFADHMKALEALLTPEQLQKWEAMKQNRKGHQPAPTDNTTSGAATKPATPPEQTWGQIKSQSK